MGSSRQLLGDDVLLADIPLPHPLQVGQLPKHVWLACPQLWVSLLRELVEQQDNITKGRSEAPLQPDHWCCLQGFRSAAGTIAKNGSIAALAEAWLDPYGLHGYCLFPRRLFSHDCLRMLTIKLSDV